MTSWGSVPSGAVLPFIFDSFDGGTGASITLTGLAVTDVEIYKGTSITQRASDAGVVLIDTDGIDIDGITGIHGFSVDTGDNTDAGFYSVGSFFTVVVSAVTIDAQTVNFVAGTFRLMAAETSSGTPQARASAIADGAITAATVADATIDAATFAANAITATVIANDAITAAKIAAGAIDAATFAADVDAEILSYIVDDATRIDASALNTAAVTSIPAILVDTNELQTDWVNGGRLDLLLDATLADTNELQTDWVNGGRLDLLLDATLADTNELQTDWVNGGRLDLILDIIAADTTTDIPALIATLQAFVDTEVASILTAVDTEVAAVLALLDDARGEPAQGSPPVNPDLATKVDYLYKAWRNRHTQTATEYALYADDAVTKDHEAVVSDDGTTFERGEVSTGA